MTLLILYFYSSQFIRKYSVGFCFFTPLDFEKMFLNLSRCRYYGVFHQISCGQTKTIIKRKLQNAKSGYPSSVYISHQLIFWRSNLPFRVNRTVNKSHLLMSSYFMQRFVSSLYIKDKKLVIYKMQQHVPPFEIRLDSRHQCFSKMFNRMARQSSHHFYHAKGYPIINAY